MSTKIHVGGLADETTKEEIEAFFTKFGSILSVTINFDPKTKKARGFGIVEMERAEDAQKAITTLNGKDLGGRK